MFRTLDNFKNLKEFTLKITGDLQKVFYEASRLNFIENFQIYFYGEIFVTPIYVFPKSMKNIKKIKFLVRPTPDSLLRWRSLFREMDRAYSDVKASYELEFKQIQLSKYY